MAEYLEDCCWDYRRDQCKGKGCLCACHATNEEILLEDKANLRVALKTAKEQLAAAEARAQTAEAERDLLQAATKDWLGMAHAQVAALAEQNAALRQLVNEAISFYHRGLVHLSSWPFTLETCEEARCVYVRVKLALSNPQPPAGRASVAEAAPHEYERACRNTQHAGCTCMFPVDGRWCGRERNDPVHDVSAARGLGETGG